MKPKSRLQRAMRAYFRLPEWLRPALAGSAIVLALLVWRVFRELPALVTGRGRPGELAFTLLVTGGAGFFGGLVHGLTRPRLRELGRAGDYLSGVVMLHGYMGALLFASPFAFERSAIPSDARGWWIWIGLITVLGLVAGHAFFSGPEGLERLQEQRRRPQILPLVSEDGRTAALVAGWIRAEHLSGVLASIAHAFGERLPVGETERVARLLQHLPEDSEGLEWTLPRLPLVAHFVPDESLIAVDLLLENPEESDVRKLEEILAARTVDPLAA